MQINVRVFYNKLSRAKYISHLDITRCMQRMLKRAEIPVWYTEGFNPHMYLTFALPLSLGYESKSESMDLRLTEEISFDILQSKLNKALPPDIIVTRVAEQKNKPDRIVSSLYSVNLRADGVSGDELKASFEKLMRQESINVQKHSKKGLKTVDIKPDCEVVSIDSDGQVLKLMLKTAAGNLKSVNPSLLTDEFFRVNGYENGYASICREAVYMDNGELFE